MVRFWVIIVEIWREISLLRVNFIWDFSHNSTSYIIFIRIYVHICIYSERFLETYVSRWLQIFARECEPRPQRGATCGGRRRDSLTGRRLPSAVSCGESRDSGGRGCCLVLSRGFGLWFIALETCRLYLHAKRVTHLLPFAWLDYSSEWYGDLYSPTSIRENWERSSCNYIKHSLKESPPSSLCRSVVALPTACSATLVPRLFFVGSYVTRAMLWLVCDRGDERRRVIVRNACRSSSRKTGHAKWGSSRSKRPG